MQTRNIPALLLVVLGCSLGSSSQNADQVRDLLSVRPADRIVEPVSDDERVVLSGQRHPSARPENSIGKVAPDLAMQRMVLVLRTDAAVDAALEELIRGQHDPGSPYYHQWLKPQEFGQLFGISQNDLDQVMQWLHAAGMNVEEIPSTHRTLVFSGTAAQVESAFHTSMQKYLVQGVPHYANAKDPEIPAALAPVVRGVVSLHDFISAPQYVVAPVIAPVNTAGNGAHFLMPQDWATIYDVGPLYNQGLDGTGQSIAVLGRVDVALSDVRAFRANASLPPNDPQVIVNGPDPGFPWCNDEAESALDVEWAGAIAKNASVKFVTSQSGATDGIALSAQYAVSHNVAPIVSLSYGLCEAAMSASGNAFWNGIWAQAAAQGMSVFVSSGDSGAAGCDSPDLQTATQGRGVNGLCSSPYSTCVGGTQFNDGSNPGQYWSSSNGSGGSSALGYIPEFAWNESSWSGGLWAGGGGASIVYAKPGWQAAPGVPADGKRDVPDVSMHGSILDAYVIQIQGQTFYVSGTSAATPSLASAMALVNENSGAPQGNVNPVFYALASQQLAADGASVFHDITGGNNSVPGVSGFSAGIGYDEATGLGSIDVSVLTNHWGDGSKTNFSLAPSVSGISVGPGHSGVLTVGITGQSGFSSPVTLASSGAPAGVTVKFSASTVTAAAPVTATFTASNNAAPGNSIVTITGTGGGLAHSSPIAVTVAIPNFTVAPSNTTATLVVGTPTAITVTATPLGGFNSAIALSVTGMPKGVTAGFAPASIASPGNGSSTLTLAGSSTAVSGVSTLTLKATGGGLTKTQTVKLTVIVPSFTLALGGAHVTVRRGGSATITASTAGLNAFNSAITLSVSKLPKGITANFAPSNIAPGTGNSTLTLGAASSAALGTSTIMVTATGGGVVKTQSFSLSVQ